ncbi:MAG: GNAT family N-acetyltransferase [Peptoniphilus sp.]|nr:GNAT family N-acetyltransferase [Peptoniphilus sp.]
MEKIYEEKGLQYYFMTADDIDDIMEFTDRVYDDLEDKSVFVKDDREELEELFAEGGQIIGVFHGERLVAYRATSVKDYEESFLKDIDIIEDIEEKIIEHGASMVDADYRGRGIQNKTRALVEEYIKENNYKYFYSTVSPQNPYSFKNVLKNGFYIVALKNVYQSEDNEEGYLRFIFYKNKHRDFQFTDKCVIIAPDDEEAIKKILQDKYVGVSYEDDRILFKEIKD